MKKKNNKNKKPVVAMLVPVCSRNQTWENLSQTDFISQFLPSFLRTRELDKFEYRFYIGIDDTDKFFTHFKDALQKRMQTTDKVVILKGCESNPCKAWNILASVAQNDGCTYFYQIGSDIKMLSYNWTSYFTKILEAQGNIGIVGGVDSRFYTERVIKSTPIVENSFFHKNNFKLYPRIFNENLKNWYSDDYITDLWGSHTVITPQIRYTNTNRVGGSNIASSYNPVNAPPWEQWVQQDKLQIQNNLNMH